MAKGNFYEINIKAAVVAGAVIGLLFFLLMMPYGVSAYGMMGYMYGTFHSVGVGYLLLMAVVGLIYGAITGAIIAIVYNWALKLK